MLDQSTPPIQIVGAEKRTVCEVQQLGRSCEHLGWELLGLRRGCSSSSCLGASKLGLGCALPGRRGIVNREVLHHVMKSVVDVLVKFVCRAQSMEEKFQLPCAQILTPANKMSKFSPLALGKDARFELKMRPKSTSPKRPGPRGLGRRIPHGAVRRKKLDAIAVGCPKQTRGPHLGIHQPSGDTVRAELSHSATEIAVWHIVS